MTTFEAFQRGYEAQVRKVARREKRTAALSVVGIVLGTVVGALVAAWRRFQPVAFSAGGFALITAAAYTHWGITGGLLAAGVALLFLEWRTSE